MPDSYQLNTQINDLYQRLAALEAQVATLSSRLGLPFASSGAGAAVDPRLSTAPDPRIMGSASPDPAAPPMGFDPMAPVPPPAPDPSFGAPTFDAEPVSMPADPRVAGLTAEVMDLVRRGKKIQAIKLYREQTNVDLKTAKNVIDHL